ncbi:MAG TPA: S9 family peptidase, partial [Sphingomicrobium sp.]|nr:S9 family peptidase [Sphingomicrobium sp.]
MRKALVMLAIAAAAGGIGGVKAASTNDPYLWLEDVSSPKALQWVEAHNAKSTAMLEADPRYKQFYSQALEIAQAEDRIPVGEFIGGQIYNFWQDKDHVRGIWRRASIESYSSGKPQWETVLDLDALAASEKANWVWKGAQCSRPAERRCLINLSDGGEDAVTIREFDLPTKSFVKGGFVLPKGKQRVAWENDNVLLISREWRKGDLGRTGYLFIAKRL